MEYTFTSYRNKTDCRFSISSRTVDGELLHVLRDELTGAEVILMPDFGMQCLSASLAGPDHQLMRIIDDLSEIGKVRDAPSRYGNPILYPWPSRIPDGRYQFGGQTFQLDETNNEGAAMHGFVKSRPWKMESSIATEVSARFACSISTEDHPDMLQGYPFPNRLTLTYVLSPTEIEVRAHVQNIGSAPMPFGFGFHPYFVVPLSSEGNRASCEVEIHAGRCWNFPQIASLADDADTPATADRVSRKFDGPAIRALGSADYNDGFTDLEIENGSMQCCVRDPIARKAIRLRSSVAFRTLVHYTPAGRCAVCLEPWTCTANAFNLSAAGIDSGMLVLSPGETWEGAMQISVEVL
jgi:aldose 1-epimerase